MPQERVDLLLNGLVERLAAGARSEKDSPDYWVVRAVETFPPVGGHRDRGIFSIYLLNLVHLWPGQGTFQPAGTLHAYLEGATVELMANSDNVLRGGLEPLAQIRCCVWFTGHEILGKSPPIDPG